MIKYLYSPISVTLSASHGPIHQYRYDGGHIYRTEYGVLNEPEHIDASST